MWRTGQLPGWPNSDHATSPGICCTPWKQACHECAGQDPTTEEVVSVDLLFISGKTRITYRSGGVGEDKHQRQKDSRTHGHDLEGVGHRVTGMRGTHRDDRWCKKHEKLGITRVRFRRNQVSEEKTLNESDEGQKDSKQWERKKGGKVGVGRKKVNNKGRSTTRGRKKNCDE